MAFRVVSYGATDVGLKRDKNEDYFCILEDEELYVVADGMGGHASGQVASRLATENVIQFISDACLQPDFEWPFSVSPNMSFEEAAVSNGIQFANGRVFVEATKDSRLEGMGTTMLTIVGTESHLVLGHVGDSRIYRYRDGVLSQVTRDHSLLNHYLDTGTITPDEVKDFKNTNIIVRAVGLKDYVEPEVQTTPKRAGDIYLMCSDGLTDVVDDWTIKTAFEGNEDNLPSIAQQLIRLANQGGGKDNITVVLLRVDEVPAAHVSAAQRPAASAPAAGSLSAPGRPIGGDARGAGASAGRPVDPEAPTPREGIQRVCPDAPTPRDGLPRVAPPPIPRRR